MLTFSAPTHTYRWKGTVVPSATQVLQCAARFDFITDEQLEAAQLRGTYVHELTHYDDLGDLDDEVEKDGEHWPRLLAWRAFCRDFGANWSGIEEVRYSELYGFAGTLDRRGTLEKMGSDKWIIDVKSSVAKSDLWGLQLAAYKQLVMEQHRDWALCRRASVRLLENGTYKFDEFTGRGDWKVFAAMLTLNQWKVQP